MQQATISPKMISWFNSLHPIAQQQFMSEVVGKLKNSHQQVLWHPNPDHLDGVSNPQKLAIESKAQIIGFGGQAGGGKTDLLLGLAVTEHKKATIFRRVGKNLDGIIDRSREMYKRLVYNEVQKTWKNNNGQIIRFRSVQYEKDRENYRGVPNDFYGFDEVTEFTESQVRFITGWNRSVNSNQRCRIVMTFNPPYDETGTWTIRYFAPWLDSEYPNPASDGEVRLFATIEGQEIEVDNERSFEHKGETITPQSRTFIRARLTDNPYLMGDETYNAVLDSLPEPLRSQLKHGDFSVGIVADPFQVIPAEWVRLAQRRWLDRTKPELDGPTGVGVDAVWGGDDKLAIAKRYDNWFAEVVSYPGQIAKDGPISAELTRKNIEGEPGYINVDVTGVGTSTYDSLKPFYKKTIAVNFSERSFYRDHSRKLKMRNLRAEIYWRMRDNLDPENGDDIALPPGNEIVADLCSARYNVTVAGVTIEDKQQIKQRIGRSPDVGEAILLANLIRQVGWGR